jgi:hypothetical protein
VESTEDKCAFSSRNKSPARTPPTPPPKQKIHLTKANKTLNSAAIRSPTAANSISMPAIEFKPVTRQNTLNGYRKQTSESQFTCQDNHVSSDDEIHEHDRSIKLGDPVLAWDEQSRFYIPGRVFRISSKGYVVRGYSGIRLTHLNRDEIKVVGDPAFSTVPVVTIQPPVASSKYSNELLRQRVQSIFPSLDEILRNDRPSWRHRLFEKHTKRNYDYLASKRGGNPYSVDQMNLIKNLISTRYQNEIPADMRCKQVKFSKNSKSREIDIGIDGHDPTSSQDDLMMDNVRLLSLVLVPECLIRLIILSHFATTLLELRSRTDLTISVIADGKASLTRPCDHANSTPSKSAPSEEDRITDRGAGGDVHALPLYLSKTLKYMKYNSERWHDPNDCTQRQTKHVVYDLSVQEEVDLLPDAEKVLMDSQWITGLLNLRRG